MDTYVILRRGGWQPWFSTMATNLAKAGHEVTVWNRTPGKNVEGAGSAVSPAEAAQGVEVVWMCLSDTSAVESVLFGVNGV